MNSGENSLPPSVRHFVHIFKLGPGVNEPYKRCVHQNQREMKVQQDDPWEGTRKMGTYRDPARCFAPLEVIERLLEIRAEAGYCEAVFLISPSDLATSLDAYGFDSYSFDDLPAIHFGDYRGPVAPNGGRAHGPMKAH